MRNEYKVDGKIYTNLAEAKKARSSKKASLPNDAVVTIYKKEKTGEGERDFMWMPFA